jgi:mRNA interferase YafQ
MLVPIYEKRFLKEVQKAQKRGKDMKKLEEILRLLVNKQILPIKNRNHKLKGNFKDYWECHIEPDWLLIYKLTSTEVILARTGTHADLFNQ